ncbi:MAG TPA: hypothetical protein VG323_01480 [Thermoanaerobaculia bacterium]|nr:hypothetical protein [Thermoanaerobaculia bacterium]
MKRSITDVLRRGILSTLANWPVILTRVVEMFIMVGVLVVAAIGLIVPMLVSAGVERWTLPSRGNGWEMLIEILSEHAALFSYLFLFVAAIMLVLVAVHSVVSAGAARIYVDAERAAPDVPQLRREQFAVFTLERWSAGARAEWLRVFWIYNGAWGVAGLILLLPIAIVGALEAWAVLAENVGGIVAASCGGIALLVVVGIPLTFVVAIWAQKAIIICVARGVGARDALRSGWAESRADFLRHFLIFFLITIVSAGAGTIMSSFFAPFSFMPHRNDLASLFFGPVQIVSFTVQSAVGNAVGCWLIACFAAMTKER